jgi:eukaryotic-like serine/threonine-protein kinase
MPDEALESLDREKRLDEAVTAFLEAQESGQRPLRQDWLARYPEVAAGLEQFFADQDEVNRLTGPLRTALQGTPPPDDPSAPVSPSAIATPPEGYELLHVLGQGGMGLVYKARQKSAGRLVALKLIRADRLTSDADVQRFRNEAEAAAQLDHPHIVPVYEVGARTGHFFFSMKLIEGGGLDEQLDRFRDDPQKAAQLVALVARAVHHAHQRGILHRDLKPSNILLDREGQPHVSDFGLAKRIEADASLTQTGAILGTPQYMAPEQTRSQKGAVTTATDVYGLGTVLYALLTGRPPFQGETVLETLEQVREREPESPRRINTKVDRDLETICLKCLQKEPARRYGSAEAVAEDLERWLRGEPVVARPPGWTERLGRWMRRHKAAVWTASLLTLVLMIVGVVNVLWWVQQHTEAVKKQAAAETEARAALEEAIRLQEGGHWVDALSAARRAEGLLAGSSVSQELQQHVRERRADLEMAKRLLDIPIQIHASGRSYNPAELALTYTKAFREFGIVVAALGHGEAVERILASTIRVQLVAALEDWALALLKFDRDPRKDRELSDEEKKTPTKLLAIARAVDPDPLRNRLRDALERADLAALKELAAAEEAAQLGPTSLYHLGQALWSAGARQEEVALIQRAQQRYPDDFFLNEELAHCYLNMKPPKLAEAVRFYTVAVALHPENPGARLNLGLALTRQRDLDGAIEAFQAAVRLSPAYTYAYNNLGMALRRKGDLDAAIRAYREGVRLRPEVSVTHLNLGSALEAREELGEAAKEYEATIELNPTDWLGYSALGNLRMRTGQFAEALKVLHVGHEKATDNPQGTAEMASQIRACQRLIELEGKLGKILKGEAQPANNTERLELAHMCVQYMKLNLAAARFFHDAFVREPSAAEDLGKQLRYDAACAAALAGCGRGADAGQSDDNERVRMRGDALEWLRADLAAWSKRLDSGKPADREAIRRTLRHWQQDPDFAGVRGPEALAKLPKGERPGWQKLWADVAKMLALTDGKTGPQKNPDVK